MGTGYKGAQCQQDQYTYFEGKYCEGTMIQKYTTLQAAKAACLDNTECGCIDDVDCDGGTWFVRKGSATITSSYGSCAWIRDCRSDGDCFNGGTCWKGTCDCPTGLFGRNCEHEVDRGERAK